jgi:hypothetical protein
MICYSLNTLFCSMDEGGLTVPITVCGIPFTPPITAFQGVTT